MDFLHLAMAGAGIILLLIGILVHWLEGMSEDIPWKFTLLLVVAVLLIVHGFGAPR